MDINTIYTFHTMLTEQKHLMIAGATGSGKSVIVNGIVYTLLHRAPVDQPDGAQLILIDPKRVELVDYRDTPHCIRYASEPDTMLSALQYALDITEDRFKTMQRERVKLYAGSDIYVIIDEFADLMTTNAKKVTPIIQRLAQIGRAARVHIILCTQCPLATVIPTKIKCNFDSIVGLHTARAQDSRNIIGKKGLEDLPQYGECIFQCPGKEEHGTNIPMIPDETIREVIAMWDNHMKKSKSENKAVSAAASISRNPIVKLILTVLKSIWLAFAWYCDACEKYNKKSRKRA